MDPSQYNPSRDVADLSGKVFLITGGTAGLGAGTIRNLAAHSPRHIYLTGRNQARADKLIAEIQNVHPGAPLTFIPCDLTRLSSVQALAEKFQASSDRLDVLLCNAGIMANPAGVTADGYELQFQTNVLAHSLLVKLLMPVLKATADAQGDARVITMGSTAHDLAPSSGIELKTLRSDQNRLWGKMPSGRWTRYGQSKLADMLYASELARREPSITSVSIHPGVISTDLFDNLPWFMRAQGFVANMGKFIPVEHGTYNQTWACTCAKEELKSGEYYEPVKRVGRRAHKKMDDEQLARELYDWIEHELDSLSKQSA